MGETCARNYTVDPVFAKTCPKRSVSMTEYERFGLFSRKRGSINSGTGMFNRDANETCTKLETSYKNEKAYQEDFGLLIVRKSLFYLVIFCF